MGNPDETRGVGKATMGALFMAVFLFFTFTSIINNKIALFVGIPLLGFIISFCIHIASQWSACNSLDFTKLAIGSSVTIGTSFVAICIASISSCRIPIASVFGPSFKDTSKVKESCCTKSDMLEDIEQQNPIVKALSYCFYMIFAMLFGMVYGNSIVTVC
jgi:hypothetical protein